MTDPIQIMNEIEREFLSLGYGEMLKFNHEEQWQSLRTAVEAQRDELAQKDARIARLEDAAAQATTCLASQVPVYLDELESVLAEHPRQSDAAIKAEALRELVDPPALVGHLEVKEWLEKEADRIEREAKEQSDE